MFRHRIRTAILALVAAGAAPAQAVVDVSAVTNDAGNPVTVRLAAGTWRFVPIDPAQGGAFTAWHPWGGTNTGCGTLPGSCAQGWMWSYFVACPGAGSVHVRTVEPGIGVPKFATDTDAFARGRAPQWLPLAQPTDVTLWIGDSVHQDNLGGVSIRIEPVAPAMPTLTADVTTIPMRSGGAQRFTLDGGAQRGGLPYLVLGSASGTSPGLPFGCWRLPLNGPDAYLGFTLGAPNTAIHVATLGVLDAGGRASPRLELAGPQPPAIAGLALHHAAVVFEAGAISGITAAVRVDFVR